MREQKYQTRKFIFGGLLSLLLASCGTNLGKTIKISDEQLTKYSALSAADAMAVLEKRIQNAKKDDMPFLAPNYFREASDILSDTLKSADKKSKDELINDIAKADAILDKGQTMMAIVKSRLTNELALKIQMDKDHVAQVFPKEYEKTLSEFSSLIEKVELEKGGNLDKEKIELLKKMQALDIKTIQYTALHESEVINEETKSNDGAELAPVTLAVALRVYLDAQNRIAQTPHDEKLVQLAGADALFAANHARYVSRRVLALQNKLKKSVELIVLEEENRLLGISTALGYNDLRNRPIEKQAEEIAHVAGEVVLGQQKSKQEAGAITDQSLDLEKRLKEASDALQQANAKLHEQEIQISDINVQVTEKDTLLAKKDALLSEKEVQLQTLNDQVTEFETQNKSSAKQSKQ